MRLNNPLNKIENCQVKTGIINMVFYKANTIVLDRRKSAVKEKGKLLMVRRRYICRGLIRMRV